MDTTPLEPSSTSVSLVAQLFGQDAAVHEYGPAPEQPGRIEIWLDGGMLGSGRTFAQALADALAFAVPGLARACDLPTD